MTMMTIAICDDMQVDARRLHKQLERIVPGSEIRIFKSGELLLEELEKEPFDTVLDCGCGTGPAIELLHEKYPEKHFTGLDLTPEMIHVAQAKNLSNTEFLVGDSENLPFEDDSFDAVICANSFHHYPNPQDFFNSTYRVLRKGGRLILRDYTSSNFVVWLMNHLEMPLANLFGHGDVKIHKPAEFITMAEKAGFTVLTMEKQKRLSAHILLHGNDLYVSQKIPDHFYIIIRFQNRRKMSTRNILDCRIMHQLYQVFLHLFGKEILLRKYQKYFSLKHSKISFRNRRLLHQISQQAGNMHIFFLGIIFENSFQTYLLAYASSSLLSFRLCPIPTFDQFSVSVSHNCNVSYKIASAVPKNISS